MKTLAAIPLTPGKLTVLAAFIAGLSLPASASDLVISQVYGGGGNSGSVYSNDFIEIFNRGNVAISLSGKSVQYASATGSTWAATALPDRMLEPGQYLLVQQTIGADTSKPLPTPDASGTLAMSGSAGKVALAGVTTPLTGTNPTVNVLDKLGYGSTSTGAEGSPTAVLTNGTGARRVNACVDTDQNSADFVLGTPTPRNSASTLAPCGPGGAAPIVPSCPATFAVQNGVAGSVNLTATDSDSMVNGAAVTSGAVAGITLGTLTAAGANGAIASVALSASATLAPGVYAIGITFTNGAGQQASCTVTVGVEGTQTIPQLQGSAPGSPYANTVQTTEGVVTHKVSSGYFLQDKNGDGNPATSDAIFIFTGGAASISVGDLVRVKGTVTEYKPSGAPRTYTELKDLTATQVLSSGHTVVPVNLAFDGKLEHVEGMLVNFTNALTVNQTAYLGDRGELTLSVGRRETATNRYRPGTPEALALAAANAINHITLDDSIFTTPATVPYLGADGTVRAGDTVTSLTGVIDYGALGGGGAGFKLQPTAAPVFSRTNARIAGPQLAAGNLRVASANVLNFFTTFTDGTDAWGGTGKGCKLGASTSKSNCRGADNMVEFVRQRDKIVGQLKAIDADVVGLMEIQNNADIAVEYLVQQLNAAIGKPVYSYVPQPPATGTDAIRVAMIYKPASLSLVGGALSDADAVNNRPPMAQTFKASNGATFSLIVNHLKSKGGCGSGPDADLGDGQGCNNATRVKQAQRLASYFIPQVVASSGDPDVLVIGDMNAHGFEDPITLLNGPAAKLVNELERFVRPASIPYSYVFEGESGYLDHALSTPSLSAQFVDATEWHANADEPTVIDYNLDGKNAAAQALYAVDAFRASDHDPVVMTLNLTPTFIDASTSFAIQRSGLVLNRATGKYSGTIILTNSSTNTLAGPFQVRFDKLPAGVTLDASKGLHNGAPFITVSSASLAPGAKISLPVVFTNPSKAVISYSNTIFSGNF